jgi:hypothetical protein
MGPVVARLLSVLSVAVMVERAIAMAGRLN